jgi:hypothetical protein
MHTPNSSGKNLCARAQAHALVFSSSYVCLYRLFQLEVLGNILKLQVIFVFHLLAPRLLLVDCTSYNDGGEGNHGNATVFVMLTLLRSLKNGV